LKINLHKRLLKDNQIIVAEEDIAEDQEIDFAEEEITDTNVVDSSKIEKEVEIVKYKAASWSEIKQNFPSFRGPGGNGIAFQKTYLQNGMGRQVRISNGN
jgi:hypothetical protein